MTPAARPPRPPYGVTIRIHRDVELRTSGFNPLRTPAKGASLYVIDNGGKLVTLPKDKKRGPKQTGNVTLVAAGSDGDTRLVKVPERLADVTVKWAAAFNAWSGSAEV
jgi:hypothetical protein